MLFQTQQTPSDKFSLHTKQRAKINIFDLVCQFKVDSTPDGSCQGQHLTLTTKWLQIEGLPFYTSLFLHITFYMGGFGGSSWSPSTPLGGSSWSPSIPHGACSISQNLYLSLFLCIYMYIYIYIYIYCLCSVSSIYIGKDLAACKILLQSVAVMCLEFW